MEHEPGGGGMAEPRRDEIRPGKEVLIVQKHHQHSGQRTRGIVARHPDKAPNPSPRHQGSPGNG